MNNCLLRNMHRSMNGPCIIVENNLLKIKWKIENTRTGNGYQERCACDMRLHIFVWLSYHRASLQLRSRNAGGILPEERVFPLTEFVDPDESTLDHDLM